MDRCTDTVSYEMDNCGDDEEELDPRIKTQLELLNFASVEINRLENEIDEARVKYRLTFTEASNKMTQVARKRKRSIQRAREYFSLKEQAKIAQGESLKAARQYQSAIGVYRAAKETVALAEERLIQKGETQLSSAWQEMLNHGTIRVMEAEKEKRRSEAQHMKTTSQCAEIDQRLKLLEKKYKGSIAEARPYFELKQQLDIKLQQQKQNVTDLQSAIKETKLKYSLSLKTLEEISMSIHEARRNKIMLMFPRQPGVGAESDHGSSTSSLSELVLDSVEDESATDAAELNDTDDVDEDYLFEKDALQQEAELGTPSTGNTSSSVERLTSDSEAETHNVDRTDFNERLKLEPLGCESETEENLSLNNSSQEQNCDSYDKSDANNSSSWNAETENKNQTS